MVEGMYGRVYAWQGVYMAGACMVGETTTAADCTHANGMHSCFIHFQLIVL